MAVYFTPWVDDTTEFKAAHMNSPIQELDDQIVINVAAIDALEEDINQIGLSVAAGKVVLVNDGGTAMEFMDFIFHDDDFIVHDDDFLFH